MISVLNQEPQTTSLALYTARMLVALRGPLPGPNLRLIAEGIDSGILKYETHEPTEVHLGWAAVRWLGFSVILIQGLTNAGLARLYAEAWDRPIRYDQGAGVNGWLYNEGWHLFQQLQDEGYIPSARMVIAGHSAGGALALALARHLTEREVVGSRAVISFGAPCPGPGTFADAMRSVDICRWMNDVDPVPCIPPRPTQAPRIFTVIGNETAMNWNRMSQPHGGFSLNEIGGAVPRDDTALEVMDVQTSIIQWFASMAARQINIHSMETYVARLQTRLATYGEAVAGPRPTTHSEMAMQVTARELAAIRAAEVQVIKDTYVEQALPPLIVPKKYRFRAVKNGKQWCVLWMELTIAIAPGKGRAQDLARAGNTLLNRLQRSAGVSTEAFRGALKQYLIAAADAGTGFSPVMRVN